MVYLRKSIMMKNTFPVPKIPKTKKMLMDEYQMNYSTFIRRLRRKGITIPRGLILPADQVLIYEALDTPVYEWVSNKKRILFNAEGSS
jgi:hypothetical protein